MNRPLGTLAALAALILPLIVEPSFLAAPAYAVTCQPATAVPSDGYPGTVVTADNFESGTLSAYLVQSAGTGTVSVSSAAAHDGACSVYLHATTDPGSLADFSTPLPSGTREVYADGWFDIAQAGISGWDVPYFRFFSGSTRFVDVYRYNNNGQLWLRVLTPSGSFAYSRLTSSSIPLNSWHRVAMHVIPQGSATTVQVWFDGASVYSSSQVNTVASSVTTVMNGAEHSQQMEDTYVDDLIVKSVAGTSTPVASFTASPSSGPAPLNVAFTDTSSGSPTSWSWDFGDGSTSTVQNPSHTYAAPGAYTATLTAANSAGSNTASSPISVGKFQPTASSAQDLVPNDSMTLSGGSTPTGTITFNLYPPTDATCALAPALTQTVPVGNGNATYSTTNTTVHASTPGTWRWTSSYSGDANNQGAASACGAESFTIANG